MAEETDGTQKPKAQLIKHTQADHSGEKAPQGAPSGTPPAPPPASPAKSGERPKLVLKKKAGGAVSPGSIVSSMVKKLPKLVLSSHQDAKADAGSRGEAQGGASKTETKDTSPAETSGMPSADNAPGSF